MYLPNQLPSKLRKLDAEHQQSNGHNKNNDESLDCGTRKSKRMGRKERKRAQSDKDEMLAPPSSPTIQQPGPSTPQHNGGSFMARSWARISGRRRRRKHANDPQLSAEVPEQNGWRPASANLAQLAHLRCESAQVVAAEANGEEETRKRHFLNRGMDRIRRSIRRSLRRNSQGQAAKSLTTAQAAVATEELPTSSAANSNGSGSNGHQVASKNYCHGDEIAVRSAACSFAVKYLGSCEVFESRGMSVCESALQHLRSRKRTVKALLYISGDGIRVVDQENNRGLIVDQTIEKVSFCAPDRHNEKGFAYICRDGATRRWMCHGFHSVKDTGERLSHAVGCAFTVCLEKKRKRDAETAAYRNAQALAQSLNSPRMEENGTEFARTNQGYRSFRQLSIAERRCDPQKAILVEHCGGTQQDAGAGHVNSAAAHLAATPRPSPNPNLFERTGSLRAPSASTPSAVPSIPPIPGPKPSFSRFNSLPSGSERLNSMPRMSLYNEPIWEGDDDSSSEQQRTEPNEQPQHPHQNGFAQTQLARDRFYRTLPHTVPSFVQAGNWLSFAAAEVPPTIPEEDRSPSQQQMNGTVEENSFDPFGGPAVPPPPPRADDWLEQTFQRASSLSTLKTTPLSAGTPKTNWPASQQGWATFPHSQSFDVATTRNWPGNGQQQHLNGGQNGAMNGGTSGPPPAHIPPPLPPWARPADPSSANHVVSAATKAHKPSAIPRPLPNHKVAAKGAHQPDGAAPVSAEMTDSGVDVANASMASGAGNRGHSRKQSGSRRIEYQLLQETDTPQSPPKAGQSVLAAKLERDGGRPPLLTDPFDVHWSQRVLEETARQRTGKRDSLAEAEKMFGWESGSTVNV